MTGFFKPLITSFLLICTPLFCYECPSDFDPLVWESLVPYFLPENHPLKTKLDAIFKRSRVTLNEKTLKQAGFLDTAPRRFSNLVVTRHKKVKGYFFKLYLDSQPCNDWPLLKHRIEGAISVRAAIKKLGYEAYFKVPKKWLYPLPEIQTTFTPVSKKHFILIAEDSGIYEGMVNKACWRSDELVTEEFLQAFKRLLQQEGLHDSILPFNTPFAKDGRAAFIDTERHHQWPIYWNRLHPSLNKKMQHYWLQLTTR